MKIKGRRRFVYGEISGRGRFNDLIIKLVRLEDVVERRRRRRRKARIKVRRSMLVLTRGRWRLRVRKVRRRRRMRFLLVFKAKGPRRLGGKAGKKVIIRALKKVEVTNLQKTQEKKTSS